LFCSVGSSRFVTQQEGKGAGILLVFYTSLHCSFRCVFPPVFRICVVHGASTDVAISNATTSIVNSSLLSAVSVADGSVDTYPGHHLLFYHFVSARERIPFVGRECQDAHMYASLWASAEFFVPVPYTLFWQAVCTALLAPASSLFKRRPTLYQQRLHQHHHQKKSLFSARARVLITK
jgi:hypothetical protein